MQPQIVEFPVRNAQADSNLLKQPQNPPHSIKSLILERKNVTIISNNELAQVIKEDVVMENQIVDAFATPAEPVQEKNLVDFNFETIAPRPSQLFDRNDEIMQNEKPVFTITPNINNNFEPKAPIEKPVTFTNTAQQIMSAIQNDVISKSPENISHFYGSDPKPHVFIPSISQQRTLERVNIQEPLPKFNFTISKLSSYTSTVSDTSALPNNNSPQLKWQPVAEKCTKLYMSDPDSKKSTPYSELRSAYSEVINKTSESGVAAAEPIITGIPSYADASTPLEQLKADQNQQNEQQEVQIDNTINDLSSSASIKSLNLFMEQPPIEDNESFDWFGDDRDLNEINRGYYTGPPLATSSTASLYDNIQPNEPRIPGLWDEEVQEEEGTDAEIPKDEEESLLYRIVPRKTLYLILLATLFGLFSAGIIGLIGYELGEFKSVDLVVWSFLLFLILFTPLSMALVFQKILKVMRHSYAFTKSEVPNYLDVCKKPIILLVTDLIVAVFWFNFFPVGCVVEPVVNQLDFPMPAAPNPLKFCWYAYADKIFVAIVLISIGYIMESCLMYYITSKFHERTFKSRIIACRFKTYVIQQIASAARAAEKHQKKPSAGLKNLSRTMIEDLSSEKLDIGDHNGLLADSFSYLLRKLKKLLVFRRQSSGVRSSSESGYVQIDVESDSDLALPNVVKNFEKFRKNMRKQMHVSGYAQFGKSKTGLNDYESKLLARDLWVYLCPEGRNRLTIDDFSTCFESESARRDAYSIFDRDHDGEITRQEFRNAVVSIYGELRDLSKSVNNAGNALGKLDLIFQAILSVFLALLSLALFNINVVNLLTLSLSAIIGLNFIIGDSARNIFHSIIFLFVHHPYDVGDTIVVGLLDEGQYLKDILTVKQINLLNTVFHRWNGQETYVPNHLLANSPFLTNLARSVEQWEKIDFVIPVSTPEYKVARLREVISLFLKQNNTDYYTVFDMHAIVAADVGESEKNFDDMEFTLRVKCRPTSDPQKRWMRHARLIQFMKIVLDKSIKFIKEKSQS